MKNENIWAPELESFARQAGEIIVRGFNGTKKISEKSSAMDIVTEFDTEVEDFLRDNIQTKFPEHQVLGEEAEYLTKGTNDACLPKEGYIWVIDPIDGTLNFAYGIPLLAVSIGLYKDNELICGVVYNPIIDEMFTAEKGYGATCNGKPIKVSAVDRINKAMLAISIARRKQDEKLFKMADLVGGMRGLGSAAVALAYVASGRLDAYWERNLNLWDIAAGILLVQEAGGKAIVWPEGSNKQVKNIEILAGNERIFEEIKTERNNL